MPNYNLGSGIKNDIIAHVATLVNRRLAHMTYEFPLTTDEIQVAVVAPDILADMCSLHARGAHQRQATTRDMLFTKAAFPGLQHDCRAELHLPEGILVATGSGSYHPANWENLTDEQRERLTAWANNAMRELRLRSKVSDLVRIVLARCPTVAHVVAAWPMLGTLVPDDEPRWKARFCSPVRDLRRYTPDQAWFTQHKPALEAAEIYLNSALMLGEYKHPDKTVRAEIAFLRT